MLGNNKTVLIGKLLNPVGHVTQILHPSMSFTGPNTVVLGLLYSTQCKHSEQACHLLERLITIKPCWTTPTPLIRPKNNNAKTMILAVSRSDTSSHMLMISASLSFKCTRCAACSAHALSAEFEHVQERLLCCLLSTCCERCVGNRLKNACCAACSAHALSAVFECFQARLLCCLLSIRFKGYYKR